jgi:hypothetical protein
VVDQVVAASEYSCSQKLPGLYEESGMMKTMWTAQSTKRRPRGSRFGAYWQTLLACNIIHRQTSVDVFSGHLPRSATEGFEPAKRRVAARDCFGFLLWYICKHPHLRVCFKQGANFSFLENIPAIATMDASVIRAVSGRRVCLTAAGHIVLGPESTKARDHVAVLLGGSTPFMLRQSHRRSTDASQPYKLLGDCYVHGCMDGELVTDTETDAWGMLTLR